MPSFIKHMVRGIRELGALESDRCAAEFFADAAGDLGGDRGTWVCFPVVLTETQGGARIGSLALG